MHRGLFLFPPGKGQWAALPNALNLPIRYGSMLSAALQDILWYQLQASKKIYDIFLRGKTESHLRSNISMIISSPERLYDDANPKFASAIRAYL